MLTRTIDVAALDANKALVRAHYDAVINAFHADAIRTQVADEFYDHQTGRPMSADDVAAHARSLHAALSDLRVTIQDIVAEGDRLAVRATWCGIHTGEFRGVAPTGKPIAFKSTLGDWWNAGRRSIFQALQVDLLGRRARLPMLGAGKRRRCSAFLTRIMDRGAKRAARRRNRSWRRIRARPG